MPPTHSQPRSRSRTAVVVCLQLLLCLALGIVTTYALAWSAAWDVHNAPFESLAVAASTREGTSRFRCFDATRRLNWGAMHADMQVHGEFDPLTAEQRQRRRAARAERAAVHPPMLEQPVPADPPAQTPNPPQAPGELWQSIRANAFVEQWRSAELHDLSSALRRAQGGNADCNPANVPAWLRWTECGWPTTCLRLVHIDVNDTKVSDPHLPKDWQLKPTSFVLPIDLPLKPLWPGMLTNVACFTAAWFTLLFAARRLITHALRLHRTRHNRCPTCGYSLAGVTTNRCPECGHPAANPDLPRVSA